MSYQTIKGALGTLGNAHRLLRSVAEERNMYLYEAIKQANVYRHQMLVHSSRTKDSASYVYPHRRKPTGSSSYDVTDLLRTFISASELWHFGLRNIYLYENANPSIHPFLPRLTQTFQPFLQNTRQGKFL
jgi:hypothetical protein